MGCKFTQYFKLQLGRFKKDAPVTIEFTQL